MKFQFSQIVRTVLMLAASTQSLATASTLVAYGTLDTNDTNQADCVRQLSYVPYGESVKDSEGKILIRFLESPLTREITAEIYARSDFAPNKNDYMRTSAINIRAQGSDFHLSLYEGIVREVVTVSGRPHSASYSVLNQFETSVRSSLNPPPSEILPLTETRFSMDQHRINFSRKSLMKPEDIGIKFPTVIAKNFKGIECSLERIY